MLQVQGRPSQDNNGPDIWGGGSVSDTLQGFIGIVRRQLPLFLIVMAVSVAIGLVYLLTTVPTYLATASMVIDTRKVQLFQQQSVLSDIVVDAGTVQTQIETLKSQNVSAAVIKDLRLTEDPEFVGGGAGFIGALFNFLSVSRTEVPGRSEVQLARRALASFEGRRNVTRVGQSYVMEIGFLSVDPEKAARIANAIADAYIEDQLEAKYQATRRASLWLQDRLKELRTETSAAQRAVVDFKEQNKIVDTGGPGGKLVNEQQLSEVNSQLILAQAATSEAKARYERIRDIMKQEIPDEAVTDALKSEVIIKLRSQYLDLLSKEAIWSQKYGPNHLAVTSLRTQMLQIRKSIADEMHKIAESYKSEYEIAQAREQSISNSLASAVSETQVTNQAQIQLRELESSAQTYRSLYENFLQRYMEAIQQQSFPITEARLISPAAPPLSKTYPKTTLVLLLTVVAGFVASFGAASLREMSDRVFRASEQVESILQVNCLTLLPLVKPPAPTAISVISEPKATPRVGIGPDLRAQKSEAQSMLGYVVRAPFSPFAEALRVVKVTSDLNAILKAKKVIGITSTLPREGKSTIAGNFAQLIAHAGGRVVLVDADLRNPSLSHLFHRSGAGLVDIIAGRATIDEMLETDHESGLKFLPAGQTGKMPHTNELLASAAMARISDNLRDRFDYVIIDLPPLTPIVDARATTSFIDSYIYIVEWGKTKIDAVKHGLSGAPELYERLLGVVLNKTDMTVMNRYERHRSGYYNQYYARYNYSDEQFPT